MSANLAEASAGALALLLGGDGGLWQIIGVSFSVSLSALAVVLLPALWCGFLLAYAPLPLRWLWLSLIHTWQAVPTVVIGLLLYLLFSRTGPLGQWHLLFSQPAMMLGQMLIAFPVIVALSHAAFKQSDTRAWETARTLGAGWLRAWLALMHECRFALLATVLGAFSRIVTEVGCAMMVGGNMLHFTRNIPTAIALETQKGNFAQGIALGLVLLLLALGLNLLLMRCQSRALARG
ncbi:MAG: ABC transporter permease [Aeromonas sp.]